MADLSKLKGKAGKGAPPAPEVTNANLKKPPREAKVPKAKIEFSVPEHVAQDFSKAAGQRFGFKKGSKSALFIALWEEYQNKTA